MLHGYDKGHRLLSASIELPTNVLRTINVLSDMSGHSMIEGFEEYVTGYPLADTTWFAIGKTWHAPEMSRPGCVWTHTLLIPKQLLDEDRHLAPIFALFRRPRGDDRDSYKRPIDVELESCRSLEEAPDRRKMALLIQSLYSTDERPILIFAESAREWQPILTLCWAAQPSSFQAQLSFCSGLLSLERRRDEQFVIQVAPSKLRRALQPTDQFDLIDASQAGAEVASWARSASRHMALSAESPFRAIAAAACDSLQPREAGRFTSELLEIASGEHDDIHWLTRVIDTVVDRFPDASTGQRLKRLLFGPPTKVTRRWMHPVSEGTVLGAILERAPESFADEDIELAERLAQLWRKDSANTAHLLEAVIDSAEGDLVDSALSAVATTLTEQQFVTLREPYPLLCIALLSVRPDLGLLPEIWSGDKRFQLRMLDVLVAGADEEPARLTRVGEAILESGSKISADAMERLGEHGVRSLIRTSCQRDGIRGALSQLDWRAIVRDYPNAVIESLRDIESSQAVWPFVVESLDPHAANTRSLGIARWKQMVGTLCDEQVDVVRTESSAFVLAIAFDNPWKEAHVLIRHAFQLVHDAQDRSQLPFRAWRWLEPSLPRLRLTRAWDNCERLRRGLAEKAIEHQWPADSVLAAIHDRKTLELIAAYCRKKKRSHPARQLLRDLATAAENQSEAWKSSVLGKPR